MSPRATVLHLRDNLQTIIAAVVLATMVLAGLSAASGVMDAPARITQLEVKVAKMDTVSAQQTVMLEALLINICLDPTRTPADFARMRINCRKLLNES